MSEINQNTSSTRLNAKPILATASFGAALGLLRNEVVAGTTNLEFFAAVQDDFSPYTVPRESIKFKISIDTNTAPNFSEDPLSYLSYSNSITSFSMKGVFLDFQTVPVENTIYVNNEFGGDSVELHFADPSSPMNGVLKLGYNPTSGNDLPLSDANLGPALSKLSSFRSRSFILTDKSGTWANGTIHSMSVTASQPVAGDFDGNGIVNGADLNTWKSNFGQPGFTGSEFLTWQRNFTSNSSTEATIPNLKSTLASVPEPTSLALALSIFGASATKIARKYLNNK